MKLPFLFTKHSIHPLPTIKTFARMACSSNSCKLSELRKLMAKNNLAAYYVPSEDAHQVIIKIKIKLLIYELHIYIY